MSAVAPGKPAELIRTAFIRGRFCELLGRAGTCPETPETLYTLGLFSALDAVLDLPMDTIVRKLPLSAGVADALIDRSGHLGNYLSLVELYERGDWPAVRRVSAELRIAEEIIPGLYLDACRSGSLLPI